MPPPPISMTFGRSFRLRTLSSGETIIRSFVLSTDAIFGRNNHLVFCFVYRCYRRTKLSFGRLYRLRTLSSDETITGSFISSTGAIVGRNDHSVVCVVYGRYRRAKQSLDRSYHQPTLSSSEVVAWQPRVEESLSPLPPRQYGLLTSTTPTGVR